MTMRAIYQGQVYQLGDDLNECQLLDDTTGAEVRRVDYGSDELLVDPTDDQLDAARQGRPLPPESCAVCHRHPQHEHDWVYRTHDGYGVCDDCGRPGIRH